MPPKENPTIKREITFIPGKVQAGFPSPGEDLAGIGIDLNEYMISNPVASFLVRVAGESMIDAGILDGDVLIVNRSLQASKGRIVIAVVEGEFTVKRFTLHNGVHVLKPENDKYPIIPITEEVELWGVVTGILRRL